ncbi:PREDICTED: transcription factor bHLH144-like [Tarenaya hassleriana]|uniref:transcription factor bHLH144-like n=1 Tax=Tarenaya hassleriana TaxID=28532 RepID=UPI00053C3373|nr:PREDICTED: transcription factor bHLH144-like [Tarenaya hassleriana]
MQKNLHFRRMARETHFPDEMGDSDMHIPYASTAFDAVFPPCVKLKPFNGVELQPSPVCPKNFIIFDQTYDRSHVMYHPEMTRKLSSPALNAFANSYQNEHARECYNNYDQEASSSFKEDSAEIDALLSCNDYDDEEEDSKEYDAEEVSTARNSENHGNLSPESSFSSYDCSNIPRKQQNGERKRRKMKKMMKVLRRIVPGGEQMNTVCILDEAVQYLKSLKVEAQKLGVGNFPDEA